MQAGDSIKAAVACGGTGGHIFPGLATALELRDRGHAVTLWLTGRASEDVVTEHWDGPIIRIAAQGFPTGTRLDIIPRAWRMLQTAFRCTAGMREEQPDVLLAMGSYASAGPCFAARWLRIPIVLHEANAIPGRAVRLFARTAAAVATGFDETRYHLHGARIESLGIPLRAGLAAAAQEPAPPKRTDAFHLLVIGGSLGSRTLNEVVPAAIALLAKTEKPLFVTHLTGKEDPDAVRAAYQQAGVDADIRPFTDNMPQLYRQADFAICRAGGSTCAELSLFELPALLVPYPHAASDHQTANAQALAKRGAVDTVSESALDAHWLEAYLSEIIHHPAKRERMRSTFRHQGIPNGTKPLADLLERVARNS